MYERNILLLSPLIFNSVLLFCYTRCDKKQYQIKCVKCQKSYLVQKEELINKESSLNLGDERKICL